MTLTIQRLFRVWLVINSLTIAIAVAVFALTWVIRRFVVPSVISKPLAPELDAAMPDHWIDRMLLSLFELGAQWVLVAFAILLTASSSLLCALGYRRDARFMRRRQAASWQLVAAAAVLLSAAWISVRTFGL